MEFDTTRPPNFIAIKGCEQRVDIGMLSEKEFDRFAESMAVSLRVHWGKRRAQIENES